MTENHRELPGKMLGNLLRKSYGTLNGKPLGAGVRSQKPSRPTKALPPSRQQVVNNHMESAHSSANSSMVNSSSSSSRGASKVVETPTQLQQPVGKKTATEPIAAADVTTKK